MIYEDFPYITREEITDLSILKDHIIYSDEIKDMTKEEQEKIYEYCKIHATLRACRENLRMIRYAISEIYFGY